MPYNNGPVPAEYTPAYLQREYQRIGEAYNVQEAFGGVILNPINDPLGVAQTVTTTPTKVNAFRDVSPNPTIGDGFVMIDPCVDPVNEIGYIIDGVYMVNAFGAFTHNQGAYLNFEVYYNGVRTYLGGIIDASQQSNASSFSFSGMLSQEKGGIIDIRVNTDIGTEDITHVSTTLQVFKMRDLRTRFS